MKVTQNYLKTLGWLTFLSGILAFACNILLALAVQFNFDAFSQPILLFEGLHPIHVAFFRWGMITDIWGYYLLFAPAVFYLYEKMETPWRPVVTASGAGYALMGAIGAAILAAAGVGLLREYLHADAAGQPALKSAFLLLYEVVNGGIWNLLEMGLLAVFMFGVAPVLRMQGKFLYYLTLVLGFSAALDAFGHTFEWLLLADIGLNVYLLLAPIWAMWLGARWVRARV